LLAGAITAWALVMTVAVVQQRRSPAATIAWLLVLALLAAPVTRGRSRAD
jgi:hypothetical protein